ncbi:MAG TPA: glycosyltransferase family 4 protein [Solirubrobacteraceae bacterium]|jgi:glycosyltransferase involved in cell wall biosynthesis
MRVQIVDPSAYTPPYDDALCRALAAADVAVELVTSRFAYGTVPPPCGYTRREHFYRLAHREAAGGPRSRARLALKAAEHVPDMLRYRRVARAADVVHFQWLTMQPLDVHLLPPRRPPAARPKRVLTAHDVLPREPRPGQLSAQRRLYERMDAVVVHTEHGRRRLCEELGLAKELVHVIPHGVLRPWEGEAAGDLPLELRRVEGPVVLFMGLLRPYKGLDVLLAAWQAVAAETGRTGTGAAELWIVGMPRMDIVPLRAAAQAAERAGSGRVRLVPRFVSDAEIRALMCRASLLVAPYREIEQSGVVLTALGAGKPLLLSDAGGFPEIAASGAARTMRAGDARALADALRELLGDPALLDAMATHARAAASGKYSWGAVAQAHLRLYERVLSQ